MTTESTLEGLRNQIIGKNNALLTTARADANTANWKALGRDTGGELITVMNERMQWQAFIVKDKKPIEVLRNWFDTKEDALNRLLESLSWQLFNELDGQNL